MNMVLANDNELMEVDGGRGSQETVAEDLGKWIGYAYEQNVIKQEAQQKERDAIIAAYRQGPTYLTR